MREERGRKEARGCGAHDQVKYDEDVMRISNMKNQRSRPLRRKSAFTRSIPHFCLVLGAAAHERGRNGYVGHGKQCCVCECQVQLETIP